jgi:alpha-1,3/alpha-1,6-mannosyltransferase
LFPFWGGVSSNTRVKLFVAYAEGVSAFQRIAKEVPEPHAISHLKAMNQEATCQIAAAADMCVMLTKGLDLCRVPVSKELGRVTEASWSEVSKHPMLL